MPERPALDRTLDLVRQFALARKARIERQLDGRLHGVEQHLRRFAVAHRLRDFRPTRGQHLGGALGRHRAVARAARVRIGRDQLASERDGAVPHVAVDNRVDQADLARLRRANRLAGQHQVQRRREPDQPRQPLGAAGAGDDAERDLGHRELRARRRDAPVATQRRLHARAHRRSVDGRDDGHGAVLNQPHRLAVAGLEDTGLELAHIAAGDERLAGASQHDRTHVRGRTQFPECFAQAGAHIAAHRVDGRAVDRDDRDAVHP